MGPNTLILGTRSTQDGGDARQTHQGCVLSSRTAPKSEHKAGGAAALGAEAA